MMRAALISLACLALGACATPAPIVRTDTVRVPSVIRIAGGPLPALPESPIVPERITWRSIVRYTVALQAADANARQAYEVCREIVNPLTHSQNHGPKRQR